MADAGDVARMRRIITTLRGHGVLVREVAGWEQRGDTYAVVPHGICDHHDASTRKTGEWGFLGAITRGRSGPSPVPGPLGNFQIARCLDGIPKVAVVAAGIANHAGRGGPRLSGGILIPENRANGRTYGAEKANDGVGEPHTPACHYATDALFAAVLEHIRGDGPDRVFGHKEWTGRKSDPRYSMAWRRERVATFHPHPQIIIDPAPITTDTDDEDDDMKRLIVKNPDGPEQFLVDPGKSRKHIRNIADVQTYVAAGAVVAALSSAELFSHPEVTAS